MRRYSKRPLLYNCHLIAQCGNSIVIVSITLNSTQCAPVCSQHGITEYKLYSLVPFYTPVLDHTQYSYSPWARPTLHIPIRHTPLLPPPPRNSFKKEALDQFVDIREKAIAKR